MNIKFKTIVKRVSIIWNNMLKIVNVDTQITRCPLEFFTNICRFVDSTNLLSYDNIRTYDAREFILILSVYSHNIIIIIIR